MIYVPKDLEEEVKVKSSAFQKLKDLTEKISEVNYKHLKLKNKRLMFRRILNYSNKYFILFDLISDISDLRAKPQISAADISSSIMSMFFVTLVHLINLIRQEISHMLAA